MSLSASSSSCRPFCETADGEFEVAKVLASLSKRKEVEENYSFTRHNDPVNKQICLSNRVKNELKMDDHQCSSTPAFNSAVLPFDLNIVDQAAMYNEEDSKKENKGADLKVEEVCESAQPDNGPISGGRSKQNLTETEKEARRIRRILANRESARQTIRRRQALYEELTHKAADLAFENESLRKNKDVAVDEFQSLRSTNEKLKEQLSQTLGYKVGEIWGEAARTYDSNTCNWPFYTHNTYSANSFMCPCLQPCFDGMATMATTCMAPSHFINPCLPYMQESALNFGGQTMPWCLFAYPYFFPLSNPAPNDYLLQISSFHMKQRVGTTCMDHKNVPSPTSILNRPSFLAANAKGKGVKPMHNKCKNGGIEVASGSSSNPHPNTGVGAESSFQTANGFSEGGEEPAVADLSRNTDSTSGAVARKRRKEVMKLKNIHCRQTKGING